MKIIFNLSPRIQNFFFVRSAETEARFTFSGNELETPQKTNLAKFAPPTPRQVSSYRGIGVRSD